MVFTYTPAVPQANEQFANTQAPIQNNFQYLQQAIGIEHNFNTGDPTVMYHKQTSMPNVGTEPPTLVSGTVGAYYIFNGVPKYFANSNIQNIPVCLRGTSALNDVGGAYTTLFTVPASSCGTWWIWLTGAGASNTFTSAQWFSDSTGFNFLTIATSTSWITFNKSGFNLQAKSSSTSPIASVQFVAEYITP